LAITVFAPAKVNLTLHITGQRADGYHLLDSLVVFPSIGDEVSVEPANTLSSTMYGSMADGLQGEKDKLVLRAARLFGASSGAAITLIKRLPVAAGIGGGSSDAAATLRALSMLWDKPLPDVSEILKLGADVPVCLTPRTCRMQGIGEIVSSVPELPKLDMLLINPGVSVSTPAVFKALKKRDNPAMRLPSGWADQTAFIEWLEGQRNDLCPIAASATPEIDKVLSALRNQGSLFAGMSGSGATCFGLFPPDGHSAKSAKAMIAVDQPDWWAAHGAIS